MRWHFLLDPESAAGGGAADGSQAADGGSTDSGDGSAGQQSGSDGDGDGDNKKFSDEQLGQIRDMFGLKEGQTIPTMITGATKRNVGEMLGIKEGEDFADVVGRVVADHTVTNGDGGDAGSSQNGQGGTGNAAAAGESEEFVGLRKEFGEVRTQMQKMQADKEQAEGQLKEERRKSAIRDALGEFEIKPENQNLITKAFIQGVEGPPMKLDDKGVLIVEDENGHPQPASAYLNGYFKENSWALSKPTASGTGARGKGGAALPPSPIELSDLGSNPDKVDAARKEDPQGTADRLREQLQEKGAKYGGGWGRY